MAVVLAVVLAAASCGGDDEQATTASTTSTTMSTPTTTSTTASTTEQPAAPPFAPVQPADVERTEDVRYGDDRDGFHPALLDVYAPPGDGPWPVVVMFHGGGGQFQDKNGLFMQQNARAVASHGAVVVVPNTGGPSADPDARDFRILEDPGPSCAAAFAIVRAEEFRGDPDDVTLAGFSGGANAAALNALSDDPPAADSCLVRPMAIEPTSVVLWEGDYLLAPWWDDTLEANPGFYEEEWIWSRIRSDLTSTWHIMLGDPDRVAAQRVVVEDPFGSGDQCGRPLAGEPGIEAAGGMCRYFELRDPTGDLRTDSDLLGHFDDGWFTIGEFSLLLAHRLEAAGVDVTTTVIEGATHNDLTPEGEQAFVDLIIDG